MKVWRSIDSYSARLTDPHYAKVGHRLASMGQGCFLFPHSDKKKKKNKISIQLKMELLITALTVTDQLCEISRINRTKSIKHLKIHKICQRRNLEMWNNFLLQKLPLWNVFCGLSSRLMRTLFSLFRNMSTTHEILTDISWTCAHKLQLIVLTWL